MEKKVVWESYIDPYTRLFDEAELEFKQSKLNNESSKYEEDNEEFNVLSMLHGKNYRNTGLPLTHHPIYGQIPLTPHLSISKHFNFWIANTNFNITRKIAEFIEQFDGIETLDIITRYRMRIGIGKVFDSSMVKSKLTKNLVLGICPAFGNNYVAINRDVLEKIKNTNKKTYWMALVAPNQEFQLYDTDSLQELEANATLFIELKERIHGSITDTWNFDDRTLSGEGCNSSSGTN